MPGTRSQARSSQRRGRSLASSEACGWPPTPFSIRTGRAAPTIVHTSRRECSVIFRVTPLWRDGGNPQFFAVPETVRGLLIDRLPDRIPVLPSFVPFCLGTPTAREAPTRRLLSPRNRRAELGSSIGRTHGTSHQTTSQNFCS